MRAHDLFNTTMASTDRYVGQRLSIKAQTCTIRYVGTVANKDGQWLGVEWDDTSRGKHNGTHEGIAYFTCTPQRLHYSSTCKDLRLTTRQEQSTNRWLVHPP